jgi:hypothetical protein
MSDEPKETQSVNKKVKKLNPKFQVFKYLLIFWGSILLLCLLVYMIPPLRNHVLLKIWSTQNWVEDTWAHKKLREGGPSAVNTLAPYLYEKVGRKRGPYDPRTLVQETMMAMGDEALKGMPGERPEGPGSWCQAWRVMGDTTRQEQQLDSDVAAQLKAVGYL